MPLAQHVSQTILNKITATQKKLIFVDDGIFKLRENCTFDDISEILDQLFAAVRKVTPLLAPHKLHIDVPEIIYCGTEYNQ